MKQVNIEWRHLDVGGETCERCGDTGSEVRQAVEALNAQCVSRGVFFVLTETLLGEEAIEESNAILIDGRHLETVLPKAEAGSSGCASCSDLTGTETECRTIEYGSERFESVPSSLIQEAVCAVVDCCQPACGCS